MGVAAKYATRLREEVERSFRKVENGNGASAREALRAPQEEGGTRLRLLRPRQAAVADSAAGRGSERRTSCRPFGSAAGQLPRNVKETEQAVLAAGAPVFARAGALVRPVSETVDAAGGGKTKVTYLRAFTPDSFVVTLAEIGDLPALRRAPQGLGRH